MTERVTDLTRLLREVGGADLPRLVSRGDGATQGGSLDRGDPGWQPKLRSDYHYLGRSDRGTIPINNHYFH